MEKKYKTYKDVIVDRSQIGMGCSIGDDSVVVNSKLEEYVEIDRRNYIHNSSIGKCTYTGDYYARKNQLNQCGVSRQSDAA